jgi:hypothetical protein
MAALSVAGSRLDQSRAHLLAQWEQRRGHQLRCTDPACQPVRELVEHALGEGYAAGLLDRQQRAVAR